MTFALLFALASAQLSGIDGTWHATIGSHDAVIALKSCSDGELIGVLPAEPTIQITGGNISGSNVIINFSGEDGGGPLSEFSFTGVLAGDNLSGTALVDGTLTTVDFNRVTANYEVQHMEVIDTDANATLLFNVVRLGGTFVG
ncbi:MAG: hypothetical protein QGF46_08170, partial [Planctomycetota bacterium]|nr:hypothetical protein [Planctomycetota bacterium]